MAESVTVSAAINMDKGAVVAVNRYCLGFCLYIAPTVLLPFTAAYIPPLAK